MKELLRLTGGYKRVMDYVLNLQGENLLLGNSLFSALGVDLVLSGCAVTNNNNGSVNIAPGLIFISGDAIRFDGANNVLADGSKAFAKGAYITSDQKQFGDGSQKNVYREAKASIVNQTPGNHQQIKITATLYDLKQYIQDTVANSEVKGTFKEIYDFDGTFRANFDSSGVGITPRWYKWVIDNGVSGSPGSAGMALIAAGTYTDPISGEETEYEHGDKIGERQHQLTEAELAKINPGRTRTDNTGRPPYEANHIQGGSGRGLYKEDQTFGGDQPHNNMQPSIVVWRVIKMFD